MYGRLAAEGVAQVLVDREHLGCSQIGSRIAVLLHQRQQTGGENARHQPPVRKGRCRVQARGLGKRPEEEDEETALWDEGGKGWHVRVFGGGLMLHQRQVARLTSSVCENGHRLVKLQVVRVMSQIKSTGRTRSEKVTHGVALAQP